MQRGYRQTPLHRLLPSGKPSPNFGRKGLGDRPRYPVDEMEESIQNRDADYRVFVTVTFGESPSRERWLVPLISRPEHGRRHHKRDRRTRDQTGYLLMAISWARNGAVQAYAEVGCGFDSEES